MEKVKNTFTTILLVITIISIIVVLALWIWNNLSSSSDSSSDSKEDKDITIWTCAQNVVKNHLKAPSTAKFPWSLDEVSIIDLGNDQYNVSSYVDSQNGFGATVRSYFTVTLTLTEHGYKDAICNFK